MQVPFGPIIQPRTRKPRIVTSASHPPAEKDEVGHQNCRAKIHRARQPSDPIEPSTDRRPVQVQSVQAGHQVGRWWRRCWFSWSVGLWLSLDRGHRGRKDRGHRGRKDREPRGRMGGPRTEDRGQGERGFPAPLPLVGVDWRFDMFYQCRTNGRLFHDFLIAHVAIASNSAAPEPSPRVSVFSSLSDFPLPTNNKGWKDRLRCSSFNRNRI